MNIMSPLEQFKIVVWVPIKLGYFDISITNGVVYLSMVCMLIYLTMVVNLREVRVVPTMSQRISEIMYIFVNDLVKQQAGIRGLSYFPVLFVLFYFILFMNLIGLLPYGFTVTTQMCNTFMLGFSMFIGVVIIGIKVQKADFVKQFIPSTTGPILVLLVIIEVISYCIRPFSLSLRLFANMLAGHTLLHILSSFGISMLKVDFLLSLVMVGPIVAICVLEFGVALLQSYVFLVLVSMYLKESFYGH